MSGKLGNWQLFEDENNNEMELEKSKQSHEERMRYYKLCDELGLIYEDIEKFVKWLRQPTASQIKEQLKIDRRFFELFNTEEIDVLKSEWRKIQDDLFTVSNKYYDNSGKTTEISDKLYSLYQILKENDDNTTLSKEISSLEKEKKKWEKIAEDYEKKQDELESLSTEIDEKISKLTEERWKELEGNDEVKKLNEERLKFLNAKNRIEGYLTENEERFNEFRKNHYNTDVERLFRRLGIDYLTRIPDEEIVNRGTIEDYISFIEDNVLSMDKLYFDDYDKYYADAVLNKDI